MLHYGFDVHKKYTNICVMDDAGTILDEGRTTVEMTAPEMVRVMAACKASAVYFAGGRIEGGKISAVVPKTPHPVM